MSTPAALPLPPAGVKINSGETAAAPPGAQSGNVQHLQGALIPTPAYQNPYLNFQHHYPHQDYNGMNGMLYMAPPPNATGDIPGGGYPMMQSPWVMRFPDQPPTHDAERKRKKRLDKNRESVRIYRQKKRDEETRFQSCVDLMKAKYEQLQQRSGYLEDEKRKLVSVVDALEAEKKQLQKRLDTLKLEKRLAD